MASPIPLIYRVLFLYVDPFFCAFGFYLHAFAQPQALAGYSPFSPTLAATVTKTTTTIPLLLENLSGFFLVLGLLEGVLLRVKADDRATWRVFQGCVFWLDVVMVAAHARALTVEGRWDVTAWRGDDYRNIVGNVFAGLPRLLCALGVGMSAVGKGKRA